MKSKITFGLFALCILGIVLPAGAITITFEEGLGKDGTAINTQYTGVTFQGATSGLPWVYTDITTGNWNCSSWPSGTSYGSGEYWINDNVAAFTGTSGNDGKIVFNAADATYVQVNYSTYSVFYLQAYNASNVLLDMDTAAVGNLRYINGNSAGPGTLRVDAPAGEKIAYVLVHDSGNYWVLDNLVTDATGIVVGPAVPEPLTLVGLSLAVAAMGGYIRRRHAA